MTLGHRINNHGHSIGIALGACTVPAAGKPSFTPAENEMEFGVGIHGEPGIARRPFTTLNAAVDDMFHTLIDHGHYQRTIRVWDRQQGEWRDEMQTKQPLTRGDRAIALVNNRRHAAVRAVWRIPSIGGTLRRGRHYYRTQPVGAYCTSLDMQGVSITLLNVDDELLSLWDAPVKTPALRWGC